MFFFVEHFRGKGALAGETQRFFSLSLSSSDTTYQLTTHSVYDFLMGIKSNSLGKRKNRLIFTRESCLFSN